MALVSELNAAVADALTFPLPTVSMYSRVLREHGLISKKGRGRGAAHATPLDAARLITSLVATPSPSQAADCVVDFGSLVQDHRVEIGRGKNSQPDPFTISEAYGLGRHHTFEEALTAIIAGFAQEQFARSCIAAAQIIPGAGYALPKLEIAVLDTALGARVFLSQHEYHYTFAALVDCDLGQPLKKAAAEFEKVAQKYKRGIFSYRIVKMDKLRMIARVVNGHEFNMDALAEERCK